MRAQTRSSSTSYGQVATVMESPGELRTLLAEVEEYFEHGATVARGATVVDVGANIGAFAIAVARRCEREARIFCFEPVPTLFAALECNLRENPWLAPGSHRAFNVALGTAEDAGAPCELYYFRRFPRDSTMDLEGKRREFEAFFAAQGARVGKQVSWLGPGAKVVERTISILPRGPVGRWLSDRVTGLVRLQVPQKTLSGVLDEAPLPRIDLLKVDVEGAEVRVLAGITPTTWATVQQAIIESDGTEERTRGLVSLLTARGLDRIRVASPASTAERGLPNVIIHASRSSQ